MNEHITVNIYKYLWNDFIIYYVNHLTLIIFQFNGLHKIESDLRIKYDRRPLQKDNIFNFKFKYIYNHLTLLIFQFNSLHKIESDLRIKYDR